MEQTVFIKNGDYYIPGVYTYPDEGNNFKAVLLLHGLLSCKSGDGFLLNKIAERLKEEGYASLRIDFCSCGESRRSRKDYNILTLTEEAKVAYQDMLSNKLLDNNSIGVLGHSYGGIISFKIADLNPSCIITLNGAMNADIYDSYLKIKDQFIDEDKHSLIPQSDGRIELMYANFYELHEKYNKDYPKYNGNYLMCIGDKDIRVLPTCSKEFYDSLSDINKELVIIEDANHTFNAKTLDYTKLNELLDKIIPWLNTNI